MWRRLKMLMHQSMQLGRARSVTQSMDDLRKAVVIIMAQALLNVALIGLVIGLIIG
jgi:hypothetical protein